MDWNSHFRRLLNFVEFLRHGYSLVTRYLAHRQAGLVSQLIINFTHSLSSGLGSIRLF